MPRRPPRLFRVFEEFPRPLWFVTFCTKERRPLLANSKVHRRFESFCEQAAARDIAVGRYVLMPDHVHLFVAGTKEFALAPWVRMLKLALSSSIPSTGPHWQEGFFDHLLRSGESYGQKWNYVLQNPVRAGLVSVPEDWPYQGEYMRLPYD
jgi:putative transposase